MQIAMVIDDWLQKEWQIYFCQEQKHVNDQFKITGKLESSINTGVWNKAVWNRTWADFKSTKVGVFQKAWNIVRQTVDISVCSLQDPIEWFLAVS